MSSKSILALGLLTAAAFGQTSEPHIPATFLDPQLFDVPPTRPPQAAGESRPAFHAVRGNYKVCFGAEIEFHPYLGAQRPKNLPLVWTARALRFGAAEQLARTELDERVEGWRYVRSHGVWSEIYEVRPEGLEQSFAIEQRGADGDLVIEGLLRSELRAAPQESRVGALEFYDASGELAVSYGAATAFDAMGRSCAVETAYDGEHLALRVPDAWLDEAQFPILVDPLIANVAVQQNVNLPIDSIDIASQNESSLRNNLIACTRIYSATDHDVYAFVCEENFTQIVGAYWDTAVAYSDRDVCVTYVPGANRWVLAHQRDFTSGFGDFSSIRLFFRDRDAAAAYAGTAIATPISITASYSAPDLGGGAMGANTSPLALLVCRRDSTTTRQNTASSEILAFPIDAAAQTLQAPFVPATTTIGATLDREHPSVHAHRPWDSFGWNVCFQESTPGTLGSGGIRVTRLDGALQPLATHTLVANSAFVTTSAPKLESDGERCLVVYGRRTVLPTSTERLVATTFQLLASGLEDVVTRTLDERSGLLQEIEGLSLAHDDYSGAFWAVAYNAPTPSGNTGIVLRLGGTGGIVESAVLGSNGVEVSAQAVCCSTTSRGFFVAHGALDAQRTLYGTRLDYSSSAAAIPYGTACGTADLDPGTPNAGNTQFHILIEGTPPDAPTFLLISAANAALPLDGIGMAGCVANVHLGSPLLLVQSMVATPSGIASHRVPLPDAPLFVGDAYVQGLYFDPFLNGLGIGATRGFEIRVR
ncbi:MAG: hypothetical protein JNM84_12630 [Planctomycetes bacterium]|nr:hypothetical protein [Planctomycetota bacterium]